MAVIQLLTVSAQSQHDIILSQFQRLAGQWEGLMEYTSYEDDKSTQVTPAKCESKFADNAWLYTVTYDEGNGNYFEGSGESLVSKDGSQVMYNGIKWNVTQVKEHGDTTTVVMEVKGKDNKKKALLRQTLQVTGRTFSLVEEVKYESGGDYFVRNKHVFRRKM